MPGRGYNFEDSDGDKRKHRRRFKTTKKGRHHDKCHAASNFQRDTEDLLESRNFNGEDDCAWGKGWDVSRSGGEERCLSKYKSDKIDEDPFSSGQQELKEEAAPTVVPRSAWEGRSPTKYNTKLIDVSALPSAQLELEEAATPGLPRNPMEEEAPATCNTDVIGASASPSEQPELEDAVPK